MVYALAQHGYRTEIRWPEGRFGNNPVRLDPDWKPQPRTTLSIYATSPRGDTDPRSLHAIVVLRDGTVIDPQHDPPPRLTDLCVWHVTEILDGSDNPKNAPAEASRSV